MIIKAKRRKKRKHSNRKNTEEAKEEGEEKKDIHLPWPLPISVEIELMRKSSKRRQIAVQQFERVNLIKQIENTQILCACPISDYIHGLKEMHQEVRNIEHGHHFFFPQSLVPFVVDHINPFDYINVPTKVRLTFEGADCIDTINCSNDVTVFIRVSSPYAPSLAVNRERLLRCLYGEWTCVPYGVSGTMTKFGRIPPHEPVQLGPKFRNFGGRLQYSGYPEEAYQAAKQLPIVMFGTEGSMLDEEHAVPIDLIVHYLLSNSISLCTIAPVN